MEATKETLRANGLKEAYIRPIVFIGDGVMEVNPVNNPIRTSIICWEWGAYLGDDGSVLEGEISPALLTGSLKDEPMEGMDRDEQCHDHHCKRRLMLGVLDALGQ